MVLKVGDIVECRVPGGFSDVKIRGMVCGLGITSVLVKFNHLFSQSNGRRWFNPDDVKHVEDPVLRHAMLLEMWGNAIDA